MDTDQAAREFLRAVRGRRSQLAFSRRLGYASNVVVKWEAGRRMPAAAETLRACTQAGIDVPAAFARFHAGTADAIADLSDDAVARWLTAQRGLQSIAEVAASAGCSRYQVFRFLNGRTRPRLPEFFSVVEALTGRLCELVAELVDISEVPSLAGIFHQVRASRQAVLGQPWTGAVLSLLATGKYRASFAASASAIAGTLGIDVTGAARCLRLLRDAGVLETRRGRFEVRQALVVDLRDSSSVAEATRKHWSRVSLERLEASHEQDLFSYHLFSVSREDYARMRKLQLDFYRQVRAIASTSEPSEVSGLMTLHLIHWDPSAGSGPVEVRGRPRANDPERGSA